MVFVKAARVNHEGDNLFFLGWLREASVEWWPLSCTLKGSGKGKEAALGRAGEAA